MMAPGGTASATSVDASSKESFDQLEWIRLNEELAARHSEGLREKLIRRTKENPLVPIGALATAGALAYGIRSMKVGDRRTSQLMMRTRVIAQGLTFVAIFIGVTMAAYKKEKKQGDV